MSLLNQKTIQKPVKFTGVGLHSGESTNLIIKPNNPNTGIVFKRTDINSNNIVYPNFSNVSNTSLNTTISNEFASSAHKNCNFHTVPTLMFIELHNLIGVLFFDVTCSSRVFPWFFEISLTAF